MILNINFLRPFRWCYTFAGRTIQNHILYKPHHGASIKPHCIASRSRPIYISHSIQNQYLWFTYIYWYVLCACLCFSQSLLNICASSIFRSTVHPQNIPSIYCYSVQNAKRSLVCDVLWVCGCVCVYCIVDSVSYHRNPAI